MKKFHFSLLLFFAFSCLSWAQEVRTGADRVEVWKPLLDGKRVGMMVNQTSVVYDKEGNSVLLPDTALRLGLNVTMLMSPEHGFKGDASAGAKIANTSYNNIRNLTVYSLYGNNKKPKKEWLDEVDAVVFDVQDVGCRFYTYLSTLYYILEACGEEEKEVIVLDRPNPINGLKVEGNYVEHGFYSYVSQYRIPYVYGLTVGEFAMLINEEGLNLGEKGNDEHLTCRLTVIPMEGWKRKMTYAQTKLPWILPSPQVPQNINAIGYPCAGIVGDFSNIYLNIGVGYTLPFQVFGAEWVDAEKLKAELDSYNLPGIAWRTIHYKPFFGNKQGVLLHGVQYFFTDYNAAQLTMINFYVMQAVHRLYPEQNPFAGKVNRMMDQVCGTDQIRLALDGKFEVADIEKYWNKDVEDFKKLSKRYYLYK